MKTRLLEEREGSFLFQVCLKSKPQNHSWKMADEKLCVKWNDFQNIVQTSFEEIRRSRDFTDVTLACENMSINAHKVILSACSPFFKRLLRAHTNPQPLIYMRGIKSRDLEAVVDFIYLGEANVFQEQLETFLALAEEFELEGLTGNLEQVAPEQKKDSFFNSKQGGSQTGPNKGFRECTAVKTERQVSNTLDTSMQNNYQTKQSSIVAPDTKAVVEALIGGQSRAFFCAQCDYKSGYKSHMREHVEGHIEGLEYPCNVCKKVYSSSLNLRNHKRKYCLNI